MPETGAQAARPGSCLRTAILEGRAKPRDVPIGRVGDHGLQREAGGEHGPHVRDGDAPLFPERQWSWNLRARAAIVAIHSHADACGLSAGTTRKNDR